MRRPVVIAVAAVLALLVVAQLTLPTIAEHRLRSRLEKFGTVQSVDVQAFPAITLLWKQADRVKVRMATYRGGQESLADFPGQDPQHG